MTRIHKTLDLVIRLNGRGDRGSGRYGPAIEARRGDNGNGEEIPVILSPYRYAPGFQNDSGDDKDGCGENSQGLTVTKVFVCSKRLSAQSSTFFFSKLNLWPITIHDFYPSAKKT